MDDMASIFGVPDHHLRLIIGRTRVDYDQGKEATNRQKHGYSLESAAYLLERRILPVDQPRMLTNGPVENNGEYRYEIMTLDEDNETVVFFVATMRPDEKVRIISFRKASEKEAHIYNHL